jgi:type II secretory pathway component GspD/PulD (secretin)
VHLSQKADLLGTSGPAASLRLNFRNAPLRNVLNYLSDAADLRIEVESNVEVERTIDLWNDKPLNKEDALLLLKQVLNEKGYLAIHKRGVLAIIRGQDAKKHCIPLPSLVPFRDYAQGEWTESGIQRS